MLVLKDYQSRALDSLRAYFAECSKTGDANKAFYSITLDSVGTGIPFNPVNELPGLPYVCIRIPTGGGKTLVAAYSVSIAAKELLHTDNSLVLWLVPSNAIREQTLEGLKDRSHPYHQALQSTVGSLTILNIEEALYLNRSDLDTGTTIIVSTIHAFRVEDTVGRKVYKDSGDLMSHFSDLPTEAIRTLDKGEGGNLYHSLANVLKVRRPIVIVDEAHNARTPLSFEMLARFNPSCIIEFTATPDTEKNPSNVLHTVSAAELKAEGMIKMPIRLETRPDWKELLSDAIACRTQLEKIAKLEWQLKGEYIRPIMLLQAEAHRKGQETITVEVVEETLVNDHKIPREEIAIATGTTNELDKVKDILSKDCPLRYVITMQALREGWDCPFAYVLCSVAEVRSTTYVEQILGRIMRLPRASWKEHPDLNMAYAFSASRHFYEAANSLTDALVQNGFERQEAKDLIVQAPSYQRELAFDETKPFVGVVEVDMPEKPEIKVLSDKTKSKVDFKVEEGKMVYRGIMPAIEREELKNCFATDEGKAAVERAYRISNGWPEEDKGTPSERGVEFSVPLLAIKQGELFEPFDDTHFLDHPWDLTRCDALLTEQEYSGIYEGVHSGEIFVTEEGEIKAKEFVERLHGQMILLATDGGWTIGVLAHWIDRNVPHQDIDITESGIFITRVLQTLIEKRGFTIEQLAHDKYRVRNAIAAKIDNHRKESHHKAFQELLLPECATPLCVTPDICFSYKPQSYPYGREYKGRYEFKKHFYPQIGDLGDKGEEFECAQYIDQLDEVEFWVRNLASRPSHSFWLQTSTDRFYPDFVCKLKDGRYLVVEYKGEYLDNPDTREKKALGELWAVRSDGSCLFSIITAKKYDEINRIIMSSNRGKIK